MSTSLVERPGTRGAGLSPSVHRSVEARGASGSCRRPRGPRACSVRNLIPRCYAVVVAQEPPIRSQHRTPGPREGSTSGTINDEGDGGNRVAATARTGHRPTPFSSPAVALLNHLVRPRQDRGGDRQTERALAVEIDDELQFAGLLDEKVGLGAPSIDLNSQRSDALACLCPRPLTAASRLTGSAGLPSRRAPSRPGAPRGRRPGRGRWSLKGTLIRDRRSEP
jgi:hypothetical protein